MICIVIISHGTRKEKNRVSERVLFNATSAIAIDHVFKPRSGKTKHNTIGICCFSANYGVLKRKSKDWLIVIMEKSILVDNTNRKKESNLTW
jgi:hypothetical protein